MKNISFLIISLSFFLLSCEKEINIKVPPTTPLLVVEAYVNQAYPHLNYVILSKSVDYLSSQMGQNPVNGATIYLMEGDKNLDGSYTWDSTSRRKLSQITNMPHLQSNLQGYYADSMLLSDASKAFIGKVEKYYKLDILAEGKNYYSITQIPKLVSLDSMTQEIRTTTKGVRYGLVTIHYFEPNELGNSYLDMYDSLGYKMDTLGGRIYNYMPAWGSVSGKRAYNDNQINGLYKHELRFTNFSIGDTVNYYFNTVDRAAYNFWRSFNDNNNTPNPFTTTVPVESNLKGENVTGCFTGFGVSHKRLIIKD